MASPFVPRGDNPAAPWVIVAAGFHFRGGMDKANAELASYLLRRGTPVHLVAHDVDPLFLNHPRATVHHVRRLAGSYALGEFGLNYRGRQVAAAVVGRQPETRVVVNGGNCGWPDVNWVHYVHHAWTEMDAAAPVWFKAKHRLFGARWRHAERTALQAAKIVVANSELTRRHLLTHLELRADKVHMVPLGADSTWGPPTADERVAARQWLGLTTQPAVAFVGALGLDRRKGFDTLWAAWMRLCSTPDWDAVLVVAGSGADAKVAADAAHNTAIAARVRSLGHTERVKDVLAAVDLLVSPVRYEPYGLNVQEAICRGVPAIVSRSAGVAERYPSHLSDMLIGDPENVDELVDLLRRWRSETTVWKQRIAPFGRNLRLYDWKDMAAAFVETISGEAAALPNRTVRAAAR